MIEMSEHEKDQCKQVHTEHSFRKKPRCAGGKAERGVDANNLIGLHATGVSIPVIVEMIVPPSKCVPT